MRLNRLILHPVAGFTFVKELTLDVQNVVAPPKPKSKENKSTSRDSATTIPAASDADKLTPDHESHEKEKEREKEKEEEKEREKEKDKEKDSPPHSPAASSKAPESPTNRIFHEKLQRYSIFLVNTVTPSCYPILHEKVS